VFNCTTFAPDPLLKRETRVSTALHARPKSSLFGLRTRKLRKKQVAHLEGFEPPTPSSEDSLGPFSEVRGGSLFGVKSRSI
jgi:hypothetical protein